MGAHSVLLAISYAARRSRRSGGGERRSWPFVKPPEIAGSVRGDELAFDGALDQVVLDLWRDSGVQPRRSAIACMRDTCQAGVS